jgi:hypothetical protein
VRLDFGDHLFQEFLGRNRRFSRSFHSFISAPLSPFFPAALSFSPPYAILQHRLAESLKGRPHFQLPLDLATRARTTSPSSPDLLSRSRSDPFNLLPPSPATPIRISTSLLPHSSSPLDSLFKNARSSSSTFTCSLRRTIRFPDTRPVSAVPF